MMTNDDDMRLGTVVDDICCDCLCRLLNLMTITSHDTYVKLIVSSLDYCRDGMARLILSKGLTAASEVSQVIIVLSLISQYLPLNLTEEHRALLIFPLAAMLTFCLIIRKPDLRILNFNTITAVMSLIC